MESKDFNSQQTFKWYTSLTRYLARVKWVDRYLPMFRISFSQKFLYISCKYSYNVNTRLQFEFLNKTQAKYSKESRLQLKLKLNSKREFLTNKALSKEQSDNIQVIIDIACLC